MPDSSVLIKELFVDFRSENCQDDEDLMDVDWSTLEGKI